MSDLERIREQFEPIPEEVFDQCKSNREADFVRRQFRSVARFGRFLEGTLESDATSSFSGLRSQSAKPSLENRSVPSDSSASSSSSRRRILSAYPSAGSSGGTSAVQSRLPANRSRPRPQSHYPSRPRAAGSQPTGDSRGGRVQSAHPSSSSLRGGRAGRSGRRRGRHRGSGSGRRSGRGRGRRRRRGQHEIHPVRVPAVIEELNRQRKIRAEQAEQQAQSGRGPGVPGQGQSRPVSSVSRVSSTTREQQRERLRQVRWTRAKGPELTPLKSLSASLSRRAKARISARTQTRRPTNDSSGSGSASGSGVFPKISFEDYVAQIEQIAEKEGQRRLVVGHRFLEDEEEEEEEGPGQGPGQGQEEAVHIGEEGEVTEEEGLSSRIRGNLGLLLCGELTRSEKELVWENLRIYDDDDAAHSHHTDEQNVQKLMKQMKRIRPLVLDGKMDLNLFWFEPEIEHAREGMSHQEEQQQQPEEEVEGEGEGEEAEEEEEVGEEKERCLLMEENGFSQYYRADLKDCEWIPVRVLGEKNDGHHSFEIEVQVVAGEYGVPASTASSSSSRSGSGSGDPVADEKTMRKTVGRVNLFFKNEDKREYFRAILLAIVRRRRIECLLERKRAVESVPQAEVSNIREHQVDNIMQLVSKTFPMEYVRLIKTLLLELESSYVYALKSAIWDCLVQEHATERGEEVEVTVVAEADEESTRLATTRRLRLLRDLDYSAAFRRANRLVSKYVFLNTPIFLDIILAVNREISVIEARWPIFEKTFSFPIEIHRFVEDQKSHISAFLKFFKKEFMIRMINIIQQHIPNDLCNFYKVDSIERYDQSRMKRFISLLTYLLRSKVSMILEERMVDFVTFLNTSSQPFFLLTLQWVSSQQDEATRALAVAEARAKAEAAAEGATPQQGRDDGDDLGPVGSLQFVPGVENIFHYIRVEILEYLVSEMNTIPSLATELYSSLNLTQRLFNLSVSSMEGCRFDIKKLSAKPNHILQLYSDCCDVLKFSPKYVETFINKIRPEEVQISDFEEELKRIAAIGIRVEGLSDNEVFSALFHMRVEQFKANLRSKVDLAKASILNYCAESIYAMNRNLSGKYERIYERLQKRPNNAEQLNSLKEYAMTVKDRLSKLFQQFRKAEEYHSVLFQFHYLMKPPECAIYMKTFEWPKKIENVLNSCLLQMDYLKIQFIDGLKNDTRDLELEIDKFYGRLAKIKHFNDLQNLELYDRKIKKYERIILEFDEKTTLYNRRERLFAFAQVTPFAKFEKLKAEYDPYFQLWNIIFEESHEFPTWESGRFLSLNYQYMKDKLRSWLESLDRLAFADLQVHHEVRDRLLLFQPHLKLVKYLLEPGLKLRHWKVILSRRGPPSSGGSSGSSSSSASSSVGSGPDETNVDNIKLLDLIDMNLIDDLEKIKEISTNAKKEFELENRIQALGDSLKRYNLEDYKITVIVEMLHDQLIEMKKLRQNQLIEFFETEMVRLDGRIRGIIEILQLWKRFKKKYKEIMSIYLRNEQRLTSGPGGGGPGSGEGSGSGSGKLTKSFKIIEGQYRQFDAKFRQVKFIDQLLVINKNLKTHFTTFFRLMDEMERNLFDYFERQRENFVRLYFLDHQSLMSHFHDLKWLCRHLFHFSKVTMGKRVRKETRNLPFQRHSIDEMRLDDVEEEEGEEQEGEEQDVIVDLDQLTGLFIPLELDTARVLTRIEEEMRVCLRRWMVGHDKDSADAGQRPCQITILLRNCEVTEQIEQILQDQKFRGLQKYQNKFGMSLLPRHRVASLGDAVSTMNKSVLLNKLFLNEQLKRLCRKEVSRSSDCVWRNIVRFYRNSSGDLTIKQAGDSFAYDFECLGQDFRVPNFSSLPVRQALSSFKKGRWIDVNGSFSLIEEVSNLLGKFTVYVNLFNWNWDEEMHNLFKGLVLSKSFVAFLNADLDTFACVDLCRKFKVLRHCLSTGRPTFRISEKHFVVVTPENEDLREPFCVFAMSETDGRLQREHCRSLFRPVTRKAFLSESELSTYLKCRLLLSVDPSERESVDVLVVRLLWFHQNVIPIENWTAFFRLVDEVDGRVEVALARCARQSSKEGAMAFVTQLFPTIRETEEDSDSDSARRGHEIEASGESQSLLPLLEKNGLYWIPSQQAALSEMLLSPHRLFVLRGPFNSGKSTVIRLFEAVKDSKAAWVTSVSEFRQILLTKTNRVIVLEDSELFRRHYFENQFVIGNMNFSLMDLLSENEHYLILLSPLESTVRLLVSSSCKCSSIECKDLTTFMVDRFFDGFSEMVEKQLLIQKIVESFRNRFGPTFNLIEVIRGCEQLMEIHNDASSRLFSLCWSFGKLVPEMDFLKEFSEDLPIYEYAHVKDAHQLYEFYLRDGAVKPFKGNRERYAYFFNLFISKLKRGVFLVDPGRRFHAEDYFSDEDGFVKVTNLSYLPNLLKTKDKRIIFHGVCPESRVLDLLRQHGNQVIVYTHDQNSWNWVLKDFYYLVFEPGTRLPSSAGASVSVSSSSTGSAPADSDSGGSSPSSDWAVDVLDLPLSRELVALQTHLKIRFNFAPFQLPKDPVMKSILMNFVQMELDIKCMKTGRGEFLQRKIVECFPRDCPGVLRDENCHFFVNFLPGEDLTEIPRGELGTMLGPFLSNLCPEDSDLFLIEDILKNIVYVWRVIARRNRPAYVFNGINRRLLSRILRVVCKILNVKLYDFARITSISRMDSKKLFVDRESAIFFGFNELEMDGWLQKSSRHFEDLQITDPLMHIVSTENIVFVNSSDMVLPELPVVYQLIPIVIKPKDLGRELHFTQPHRDLFFKYYKPKHNLRFLDVVDYYVENRSRLEELYQVRVNHLSHGIERKILLKKKIDDLLGERELINLDLIRTKRMKEEVLLKNLTGEYSSFREEARHEEERLARVKQLMVAFDAMKEKLALIKKRELNRSRNLNGLFYTLFQKLYFVSDEMREEFGEEIGKLNYPPHLRDLLDNDLFKESMTDESVAWTRKFLSEIPLDDRKNVGSFRIMREYITFFLDHLEEIGNLDYDLDLRRQLQDHIDQKSDQIKEKRKRVEELEASFAQQKQLKEEMGEEIETLKIRLMNLSGVGFEELRADFAQTISLQYIFKVCFYVRYLSMLEPDKRESPFEEDEFFLPNLQFYLQTRSVPTTLETMLEYLVRTEKRIIVKDVGSEGFKMPSIVRKRAVSSSSGQQQQQQQQLPDQSAKVIDCYYQHDLANLVKVIEKMTTSEDEFVILRNVMDELLFRELLGRDRDTERLIFLFTVRESPLDDSDLYYVNAKPRVSAMIESWIMKEKSPTLLSQIDSEMTQIVAVRYLLDYLAHKDDEGVSVKRYLDERERVRGMEETLRSKQEKILAVLDRFTPVIQYFSGLYNIVEKYLARLRGPLYSFPLSFYRSWFVSHCEDVEDMENFTQRMFELLRPFFVAVSASLYENEMYLFAVLLAIHEGCFATGPLNKTYGHMVSKALTTSGGRPRLSKKLPAMDAIQFPRSVVPGEDPTTSVADVLFHIVRDRFLSPSYVRQFVLGELKNPKFLSVTEQCPEMLDLNELFHLEIRASASAAGAGKGKTSQRLLVVNNGIIDVHLFLEDMTMTQTDVLYHEFPKRIERPTIIETFPGEPTAIQRYRESDSSDANPGPGFGLVVTSEDGLKWNDVGDFPTKIVFKPGQHLLYLERFVKPAFFPEDAESRPATENDMMKVAETLLLFQSKWFPSYDRSLDLVQSLEMIRDFFTAYEDVPFARTEQLVKHLLVSCYDGIDRRCSGWLVSVFLERFMDYFHHPERFFSERDAAVFPLSFDFRDPTPTATPRVFTLDSLNVHLLEFAKKNGLSLTNCSFEGRLERREIETVRVPEKEEVEGEEGEEQDADTSSRMVLSDSVYLHHATWDPATGVLSELPAPSEDDLVPKTSVKIDPSLSFVIDFGRRSDFISSGRRRSTIALDSPTDDEVPNEVYRCPLFLTKSMTEFVCWVPFGSGRVEASIWIKKGVFMCFEK